MTVPIAVVAAAGACVRPSAKARPALIVDTQRAVRLADASPGAFLKPDVSICIPAWQAEVFIGATLECARNQTYPNVRILISIDQCSDRTADICRELAAQDARIVVFEQDKRLGWGGNVNFLLEKVQTPLFFFLWHDDLIGPGFIETLATALADSPAAMSAYGNTRHFGGTNTLTVGQTFADPVADRLIEVLTSPTLHGLSRCMMHSEIVSMGLRIPQPDGRDYYENNTAYFIKILASGPIIHVPEAEYQRRNGTGISVVDGWLRMPLERALEGFRHNATICMDILRDSLSDPRELEGARYCLYLFLMERLRKYERGIPDGSLTPPREVCAEFEGLHLKSVLPLFDNVQRQRVLRAQARLHHLEGEHWFRMRQWESALASFTEAAELDPEYPPIRRAIEKVLAASSGVLPAGELASVSMRLRDGDKAGG